MTLRRLLPICLCACASVVAANAQSAAPAPTLTLPETPSANGSVSASSELRLPAITVAKKALPLTILSIAAQSNRCFAMRSYGFSKEDLASGSPRPSSSTQCTAASSNSFKSAEFSNAK